MPQTTDIGHLEHDEKRFNLIQRNRLRLIQRKAFKLILFAQNDKARKKCH